MNLILTRNMLQTQNLYSCFESMFPWKNIVYVMRKQNLNENQNSRDIT